MPILLDLYFHLGKIRSVTIYNLLINLSHVTTQSETKVTLWVLRYATKTRLKFLELQMKTSAREVLMFFCHPLPSELWLGGRRALLHIGINVSRLHGTIRTIFYGFQFRDDCWSRYLVWADLIPALGSKCVYHLTIQYSTAYWYIEVW